MCSGVGVVVFLLLCSIVGVSVVGCFFLFCRLWVSVCGVDCFSCLCVWVYLFCREFVVVVLYAVGVRSFVLCVCVFFSVVAGVSFLACCLMCLFFCGCCFVLFVFRF